MKKILPILIIVQSCIGAGDMFAKREKIIGNYYLVEQEDGGYGISYKIDGSYIGRNPPSSRVLAYAIKDSILIIKSQDYKSNIVFLVLNMSKDNGYSNEDEIYLDTVQEGLYKASWIDQAQYKFIPVK